MEEKAGHIQCPSTHFHPEPGQNQTHNTMDHPSLCNPRWFPCATRKQRLPRLGACSVVAAVTQEKRLSDRASRYTALIAASLLPLFAAQGFQHTLLKSHIGKRSCSAQELILTPLLCKRHTFPYCRSHNFSPSATGPALQDKHLIQKVCFQTALLPQQPG